MLNLILGHMLYGLLVGSIALFAAAVSENAATAAIIALAFTIGSWVLDFTVAGRPGLLDWLSRLSLTQTLRTFEQGLLSASLVVGIVAAICGFAALAVVWLHPGVPLRTKFTRSIACVVLTAAVLVGATQIRAAADATEDRRNSFPAADQRALPQLKEHLLITVHLASEDPRYVDLRRNVLSKLERTLPDVTVRLAGDQQRIIGRTGDEFIRGSRIPLRRTFRHQPLDQPARDFASPLRTCRYGTSSARRRGRIPRISPGSEW